MYNLVVGKRVLGVLGGRDLNGSMFKLWAKSADILFAADSGADAVVEHGFLPDAVVGDMDSISPKTLALNPDLIRDNDQNRTDCDKLLAHVQTLGHRAVTLIGVEGDRIDHLFATLHSCVTTPLDVRIAIRDGIGHILPPGTYRLPSRPGQRISLLPLLPSEGVTLEHVRWPVNAQRMAVGEFLSISNEATAAEVHLQFTSGALLVTQEVGIPELPVWPDQDGLAILAP